MRNIAVFIIFSGFVHFFAEQGMAQLRVTDSITITGVVLESDSLRGLPQTYVISNRHTGTVTDANGYFTFQANAGDTLTFKYLGYKPFTYIIPDSLSMRNYMAGIILNKDTILLSEVIILPWMNRQQFRQAFISNVPDQETQNATRNLNILNYQSRQTPHTWDPDFMVEQQIKQYSMNVEYKGMISPNQQLNLVGLVGFLVMYSHQQLTKEEKTRRLQEELRQYILEERPK